MVRRLGIVTMEVSAPLPLDPAALSNSELKDGCWRSVGPGPCWPRPRPRSNSYATAHTTGGKSDEPTAPNSSNDHHLIAWWRDDSVQSGGGACNRPATSARNDGSK